MSKKLKSLVLLTLMFVLFSASDQPENKSEKPPEKKITVAVYPIKVLAPDKSFESYGPILTSFLVTKLSKSTKLKVIEQEMTAEVEKQLEFANSDKCDATTCPVPEIGKAMAAQKLVVGQVAKLGQKYTANIRVIDIEKKVIDFSVEEQLVCKEEDLDQLMELAALDLREKFGEKVEMPHPSAQPQVSPASPSAPPSSDASLDSQNILGIVVVDDLSASEKRKYEGGVRVKSISPDSPCKNIFKPGDIVTYMNPQGRLPMALGPTMPFFIRGANDFRNLVAKITPGASVGFMFYPAQSSGLRGHYANCVIPSSPQTTPQTPAPPPPEKKATNKK